MAKKSVEFEIIWKKVEIRKFYLLKQNALVLTEIYLLRKKTLFIVTLLHVKNLTVTMCLFLKKGLKEKKFINCKIKYEKYNDKTQGKCDFVK